jgi:hypothetical protein
VCTLVGARYKGGVLTGACFALWQATLLRGTLHLLPVDEAEPLIREGSVEPVDA